MWATEMDHKSVARYVSLIPETFVHMIKLYLRYSHELAVYLVDVMTCFHCYEDLSVEWRILITRTYNKVIACMHCHENEISLEEREIVAKAYKQNIQWINMK